MKDKVLQIIKEYALIEDGDNIVIGLSGGPDSMALFHILMEIKEEINFNIIIAHVNHGVRGKEALEDEAFVENIANKFGFPYYSKFFNMNEYARQKGISEEEAGRAVRYGFFREILSKIGGGKIAIAHNKNDQAETLLMRFFRGTGMDGLRGMEYKRGDIIRPILSIERAEIEEYLAQKNIDARLDKTNLEPIYNRNKIRLELIPYIEKRFNPNIIDALWRTSNVLSNDLDFLNGYSDEVYRKLMIKKVNDSIILNRVLFIKEHKSIQYRVIRKGIHEINGDLQGFTNRHIFDAAALFLEGGTGKSIDLTNNIIARVSYNEIIIEKRKHLEQCDFIYELALGSLTYIEKLGISIDVSTLPIGEVPENKKEKFIKYFDYNKVMGALYIRNRKDGDYFVPFGMKGNKKIKDYFIDEKIPRNERNKIPIITDESKILWIVGYRSSDIYKLTADTTVALRIKVINEN